MREGHLPPTRELSTEDQKEVGRGDSCALYVVSERAGCGGREEVQACKQMVFLLLGACLLYIQGIRAVGTLVSLGSEVCLPP